MSGNLVFPPRAGRIAWRLTAPSALLLMAVAAAAEPALSAPSVRLMRTPDEGIQPQTAVDADGTVHLIYFKGEPAAGNLYYRRRHAGEQQFSPPLRVNSHADSAVAMGTIRGAQLAIGKAGRVHIVWNGSKQAQPRAKNALHDTPMLYTRLDEAGAAFEPQRNLITHAFGLDGGGSVAADQQGNVYVAWHANPEASGEADRRVFMAVSRDEGQSFASETAVSKRGTGVCACCGMKMSVDHSGRLLLLYRSASDVVHRDVYLLRSDDDGRSFDSRPLDQWHVATCPMSSAAIAVGPSSVVAGWETAGQVRFGWIGADGLLPRRPIRPGGPASGQKHPAAAVNADGAVLLVWTEGIGWNRGGNVAWRMYDPQGRPLTPAETRAGVPVWSLATAFAEPDGGFTIVY